MHITVATTAEGCEQWLLELDVDEGTTIGKLKDILGGPPHRLGVTSTTKVLGRQKGVLTTLFDREEVPPHITLLNVNTDKVLTFPPNFVWGSATAAYQIEGAVQEDGRTPSIWDTFSNTAGKTHNGDTGVVACDHYHKYRDDVRLMKDLKLKAYRFSISWSRMLPEGRGDVNPKAVAFYNSLLDELQLYGIEPMVTIYHWDLPQCLEDEYGGWLGPEVVNDFEEFAIACFSHFGNRVRWWLTLNEPWCAAALGYASGEHAPGKSKKPEREPYIAAHHMILAHARAVRRYRADFQDTQQGSIGIALNMDWKEPLTDSDADVEAQRRALDWQFSWFADPFYKGHYPETMRRRCGDRLPTFTEDERKYVKGTLDFLGLNHYSSDYVSAKERSADHSGGYFVDQEVNNTSDPLWPKTDIGWDIVPWGLHRLIHWIQREYAPPGGIFITENGCAVREEDPTKDTLRKEYLQGYLAQVHKAIEEGADVRGYFVWSFMDNFEWQNGYSKRFGIVRVDFASQKRTPKDSAALMSELASTSKLEVSERVLDASEFSKFNTKFVRRRPAEAHYTKPPEISGQEAQSLLKELCERYRDAKFQAQLVGAFRQYMMDNDASALRRARNNLCLPIQADVLPKYGFEPTRRGVFRALAALQALTDSEVQKLHAEADRLLKELPNQTALEGAVG
mmetsp:Transcript_89355/g.208005  ORF Transcript_89355/g.208005 Transcript_89355/m.208005 type:complete len:678 (+) Transcript_89355:42-2075(+)